MQSEPAPWVNRLALAVLALMLLYVLVGLPDFNRDAAVTTETDAINPLNRFIWLGLLAAATPVALVRWREAGRLLRAVWPLLALYAYFALSTSWALDPAASTRRLLFSVLQLLLTATLLCGLRRAVSLHVLIAAICAVAAAGDVLTWVAMPGYAMTDEGFAGFQTQKNQTGLLMMYGCLATATAFFLKPDWRWRGITGGATAMMALLLVATRSTTSQSLTLLAPIVMPAILLVARLRPSARWAVAFGVPAAVTGLFFAYVAVCAAIGADPWHSIRHATFTGRTDLWSFAWGEIAKRPWFGAGYASFWAIDPAVQPSLKTDMWFGTYAIINEAHEGYLDLLAEGGIFGLLIGLGVVFRTLGQGGSAVARAEPAAQAWRSGRLAYPTAAFHLSLLVGLLFHNLTESNLFSNNSVLAVAFMVAALDLAKWRLAAPRAREVPFPNPAPVMRRPVAGAAGLAGPAP